MNRRSDSSTWDQVLADLAASWDPNRWCDVGVVIGCSGGADSVALFRALAELRQRQTHVAGFLTLAHFNHRMRGDESDADESFVRGLADHFDTPLEVERGDGVATDEATMRDQRLKFLLSMAMKHGARYVAVAHTADDNVETVLHHLMRGTGPRGLTGIAPIRPLSDDFVLIRPLLSANRRQLRQALAEIGQSWREDSSNANTDYRRNWIRRQLIPLVESQYPGAIAAIGRAIEGQRQWRETIDRQADAWLQSHLIRAPSVTLRRDPESDPTIVIAALQHLWDRQSWPRQEMARPQWLRLATTVVSKDDERYSLPSAIEVEAESSRLTIRRPQH